MINENKMPETVPAEANRVLDFPFVGSRYEPAGLKEDPASTVIGATEALNEHFANWSSSVSTARMIGGFAVVTVRISASGASREGIGFSEALSGEGFVAAERQAFCDAASRFPETRRDKTETGFRAEASSIADLISYRQLREIKALAADKAVDADEESERLYGVLVSELSREAASRLIVMIRKMPDSCRPAVKLAG